MLYWNETLRSDSYKSKLDMTALFQRYNLDLEPLDHFGPEELERRHKILFELTSLIWNEGTSTTERLRLIRGM